jgi:acyl carrier protein
MSNKVVVKEWVLDWFIKEKSIPKDELLNQFDNNYFENGFINSLAFVNFLVDIESMFQISLENNDFTTEGFFTLKGTVQVIESKINSQDCE